MIRPASDNIQVIYYADNMVLFRFTKYASVNRLYRHKKGQNKPYAINSKIYLEILSYHNEIIDKKFLQCNNYKTIYILIHGDNRRRDLSNHIKLFEDIVHRLFIKDDDSKVKHLTITDYHTNVKGKYMLVIWNCLNETFGIDNEIERYIKIIANYLK